MIKPIYCTENHSCTRLENIEDISEVIANKDNLLWVDLSNPTKQELKLLTEEFNLHPLAVEDVVRRHQRPKLEQYEGFYFVVFYALQLDPVSYRVTTREIALFIGKNYLLTVHYDEIPGLQEAEQRWADNTNRIAHDIGVLLYSVLDTLVDDYFPILDQMVDRTEELEEGIFKTARGAQRDYIASMLELKRGMLMFRRVAVPERDLLYVLARQDRSVFSEQTRLYFQDVYDHLVRVTDTVDTYRELLSSAVDANLSVISNDLNKVMRTLTATSVILMSASLISGIYGMNFENMPELKFEFGYWMALGMMLTVAAGIYFFFKHQKWF